MDKPFEQRNQSDSGLRKLKSLAKCSGVDLELVTALANFTWDYDPVFRNEATGWVVNETLSPEAEKQRDWIANRLNLPPDFTLASEQAAQDLIQAHAAQSAEHVWANFLSAAVNKNYGPLSEFASHHYLRGLDRTRVNSLAWEEKPIDVVEIARNLFLKLFRGGTIERDNLAYLWCDLTLPFNVNLAKATPAAGWLEQLLDAIEALPPNSGLKDLLACCKGIVGGDKYFKQEVLQSLSYADILRVNGLPVREMFIPERRNELSPLSLANEWTFPLRFWAANGGSVHREAIPEIRSE